MNIWYLLILTIFSFVVAELLDFVHKRIDIYSHMCDDNSKLL